MGTTPPQDSSNDTGLRFDRADEQERAGSRRLLVVVGLIVGPSVGPAALGFRETAVSVFLFSVAAGVVIVLIHERAELIEGASLLEGESMPSVVLSAGIVILAGLLWHLMADWILSWFQ